MPWWLVAAATVVLVLAAAKFHGRQIRVERELQGHFHVDYRGQNPPAVEDIWRRDRRLFWPVFAVLATGVLVLVVWNRPPITDAGWVGFTLALSLVCAFMVAGAVSWIRAWRREPAPWSNRALRGSLAWWFAVVAAGWLVRLAYEA
ncbi:MAG TPA: hypothetical protein VJ874_00460 [Candidatus Thermoplasmatota archaeon]|nr:hypothetical protein [Candidatus Thermoplasmatota archaeon]